MRIRFSLFPTTGIERSMISLINGYPDGLRSELVRRLIAAGFNYHADDVNLLLGDNIHSGIVEGGVICKFNISPQVPSADPSFKAFNKAKKMNALAKPIYLNKLLRTGYLIESGQLNLKDLSNKKIQVAEQITTKPEITTVVITEPLANIPEVAPHSNQILNKGLSLKDNSSIKNSLKQLLN